MKIFPSFTILKSNSCFLVSNKQGSALLVSILIMGVLIAISLALSTLIFREVRVTKGFVESHKAYYAAESGVEEALYYLNTELPGWSAENVISKTQNAEFKYSVNNSCNSYPCFDEDEYFSESVPLYAYYGVLNLNEAITIPLFTVKDGEIVSVKDFTVEFFPGFDPTDLKIKNIFGWDILRWKVFGMVKTEQGFITDTIGDFTAFSSAQSGTVGDIYANVANPSWFGTVDCDNSGLPRGSGITSISCPTYSLPSAVSEQSPEKICQNTEARDFYGYVAGEVKTIHDCYPISKFMEDHQPGIAGATGLNYLNLTNLMNPSILDDEKYYSASSRERASRIYFRVETFDTDTVREYAQIVSEGFSDNYKQSLKVSIKRGSFMPVFNFSLYSTYKDESVGEGSDYWYNE